MILAMICLILIVYLSVKDLYICILLTIKDDEIKYNKKRKLADKFYIKHIQ